jgi:hypothetical protein
MAKKLLRRGCLFLIFDFSFQSKFEIFDFGDIAPKSKVKSLIQVFLNNRYLELELHLNQDDLKLFSILEKRFKAKCFTNYEELQKNSYSNC